MLGAEQCADLESRAGLVSPEVHRSVAAPYCPHPAGRTPLRGDTPPAEALPAPAAGTQWVPAPRETSATCRGEAGAPRTGCYGCSSPEGGAELCVMSQPGAAETETVERPGGRGAA